MVFLEVHAILVDRHEKIKEALTMLSGPEIKEINEAT
jgi:hypothetical protein